MASQKLADGHFHAQYGMRFFLEVAMKIGITRDIIKAVFHSVCLIHYHEPQELIPAPEGEEVTDEEREKVQEQNEEIEKSNELFSKLK